MADCALCRPPDQPSKPEESAREASSEQKPENEASSTTKATADIPADNTEASVTTNFEIPGQDAIIEAAIPQLDNSLVKSAFQQLKATDAEIQAGIAEALARHLAAGEATTAAVGDAVGIAKDVRGAPTPVFSEPTVGNGAEAEANTNQDEFVVSQETEFASLPAETNIGKPKAPAKQQQVPKSVQPDTMTPAPSNVEAVATMTEPAELKSAASTVGPTPAEDSLSKPAKAESDFVVDPIPDTLPLEEETVVAMTQELEHLEKIPEATDAEATLPTVPESRERSAVADAPKQSDTIEAAVAAETSVPNHEGPSVDRSLDAVRDEELEKRNREDYAEELAMDAETKGSLREFLGDEFIPTLHENERVVAYEGPEPSRIPRNVAAYYLQPLRKVAEYGVPACDLQLRSYSVRPLESFCDFALRAAYYLGLPAYGPVPLPKIIERWTVPRSSFIFKKSQENFERITRRRLIQIKDANPETVQIWLAFLQKHQQAAVGMKANLWEFSSIGKLFGPVICCVS